MAFFAWWELALAAVLVVLALVIVALRRRRASGMLSVRAARVIALIYGGVTAISTVVVVAQSLDPRGAVQVDMPVKTVWPHLPKGASVDGLTAHVESGGFSTASVALSGLDAPARIWLSLEHLLQGATGVVIAVVIVMLCTSILRNAPFNSAVLRAVVTSAITILVGGISWQICGNIGGWLASIATLRSSGWMITNPTTIDDLTRLVGLPAPASLAVSVQLWPIGAGLALFALAAAFRRGLALQKDTEGLV